jgi:unsaturated rhamnogalacturonyl hydrolase
MHKVFYLLMIFLFISCHEELPFDDTRFKSDLEVQISDMTDIYGRENISLIMKKVCSWQLLNPVELNDGNGMAWARSAFYPGVLVTYSTTSDPKFLEAAREWADRKSWKLDDRYDHPDDHSCGQTYLELYFLERNEKMVEDIISIFNLLISENPAGRELYWWADALFMSPTVLARLYKATGNRKYLISMNDWWWDSYDLLYDPSEDLFFQSHWFFNKKTPNGYKTFWARANGWVMAGTVTILNNLQKDDSFYGRFADLHLAMCEKIASLQKDDGLWRPSLLDSLEAPYPETSSSGFFTYALAWGINQGILDREKYTPHVIRAWKGLVNAVHPTGKLGWVQPGGSKPDEVRYEDYQEYGAGAFLLAASEIYKMNIRHE